ncbi:MAG: outer membrane lipid asymmetry maintenance protein MlaD [Ruminobacter sp.]|nr:outer membrane lipid asymmetry maintenance protein MlaD [Ruminobacter sp.]
MKFSKIEFLVGLFVLFGLVSLVILALKIAGLTVNSESESYVLKANFDNIGSLKIRAPVKVGGVVIGRVTNIYLDQEKYVPVVEMSISKKYDKLSNESKASILTAGLIGDQYIGVTPGFYDEEMGSTYLKEGDSFEDTGSAIVLEDLIGKFLYSMNSDKK